MINNICASKQSDETKVPWGDIVEHNPTQGRPNRAEKKNDHDRGTFGRTELLFGSTQVTSQEEGTAWKCTTCVYQTDTNRKLRDLLSVMRRRANAGDVYCPYFEKKYAHMGNTKVHIDGFPGRKFKRSRIAKQGQKSGMR